MKTSLLDCVIDLHQSVTLTVNDNIQCVII